MNKMYILFLDDDPMRTNKFEEHVLKIGFDIGLEIGITKVETAQEALEALGREGYPTFDLVSLDHDLGGQHFADSDGPNTGFRVARFISGMDFTKRPLRAIIHSWNPEGTAKMFMQLACYPAYVAAFATPGYWALVDGLIRGEK